MGVPALKGPHDAKNISETLEKLLAEYEFPKEKIHLILRDGASAMVKATFLLGIDSFHCFLHVINLASVFWQA